MGLGRKGVPKTVFLTSQTLCLRVWLRGLHLFVAGENMRRKTVEVTGAELAVLEMLWKHESATIREITDAIYKHGTTGEYAAVQKLLERLEAKGCVDRNKSSFAHSFSAAVSRTQLIGDELESLAKKLCHGSLTPLLVQLTETIQLSKSDREALRKLIDES